MNHKFEDVEVKENGISLLEESLKRKRKKCMIGLGSMTDPYIKEELELNYTRQALDIINKYGFGVTLITKSANVLRDLDLFKEIHSKSKCVIQMTLTTYDEELCKKIEPNVSTTRERVEALKILRDEGIPTVVSDITIHYRYGGKHHWYFKLLQGSKSVWNNMLWYGTYTQRGKQRIFLFAVG